MLIRLDESTKEETHISSTAFWRTYQTHTHVKDTPPPPNKKNKGAHTKKKEITFSPSQEDGLIFLFGT